MKALGDKAHSNRTIFNWFNEFKFGKTNLEDEPRSGRPLTAVTQEKIELELIEVLNKILEGYIRDIRVVDGKILDFPLEEETTPEKGMEDELETVCAKKYEESRLTSTCGQLIIIAIEDPKDEVKGEERLAYVKTGLSEPSRPNEARSSALVAKRMTGLLPSRDISVPLPGAFKNIDLADPHFDNKIWRSEKTKLYTQRARWGWIISGKLDEEDTTGPTQVFITSIHCNESTVEIFRHFWDFEEETSRKKNCQKKKSSAKHSIKNSTIVLTRLKTFAINLPSFVRNRVAEIQVFRPAQSEDMYHKKANVCGDVHPHGCLMMKQTGPRIPRPCIIKDQNEVVATHALSEIPVLIQLGERCSSLSRYIRTVTWILHIHYTFLHSKERNKTHLTFYELKQIPEDLIIRATQPHYFPEEKKNLFKLGTVGNRSNIDKLTTFLDDPGINRVAGIKGLKYHLRHIVGSTPFTYEELLTVVVVVFNEEPQMSPRISITAVAMSSILVCKAAALGDWPKWIRRFERFRQASGLINNPENEQVNMLVYCMGDNADDILLSCKIASDQLKNYGKVIECFESHFILRLNVIYERARFNQRCQQEGEKVNEFITALHSLDEHCNFGMLHDELIRDRIVVGVRDRALSERMQLDTDLTLVKATLMAKQLESVKEQQSSLYQQDSIDQIKKMPNHIKKQKARTKIRQFKSNQLGGSSHGCTRCGNSNNHDWKNCPAMNSYCSKCKKRGHYAKVYRSEAINEIKSEIAFLGSVEDNSKKWIVPIKVNNRQINFKIDTGADVNVLPLQYYYQSFQRIKLEKSDKILQGPNGIPLETVGMIHVKLQNKGQHLNSKIYIVDKLKQPLLSGETSEKLNIVRMIQQLSSIFLNPKRDFPEIFNGLGHAKINYKISLQPDAKPYALCTPRRVPIPLMKQVKEQLEEMTRLGVIESVEEPTEWCAGMVAVSKPGGKIRICLGNACYFSKLDANSGFWQFGLAKESQKLTTFITPFGRFFFKRIPFGITSAPEIFQRKMTQLLGKIEGVVCFMDDIVVYGSSLEEHNERVRQVLKKIQEEGMTLNPEKCQFGVKTVKFLGHSLSSEGLFIDEEKLDAITKMEAPRSTKELKSFLGMVNYLGKFIPNLADKLQPLNSLLSTKNEWVWDEPQKKSFNLLKQELVSRPNLALFDPSRTTIVSADASSFGLGGVLRQEQPDGSLKPIAYVSRTLSETEKRYSQIEKEGLAIVWTCDRLKDYVTGIKIHIETDHKPLIAIFTSKSLEDMTPRLLRLK
ncbi:hypothetical protein LAZ67_X000489 [Cordylochernes scorpioides]|uniref:Reverse transcriptase domain-containing protein n=1 Tax=Cordylochernes scorpioides TaxID=51811 RepID=A0ABY6LVP2_9ARAC|nr:hypothetical protein LAZ67_X000489 [Cordylochernes scorpioides]